MCILTIHFWISGVYISVTFIPSTPDPSSSEVVGRGAHTPQEKQDSPDSRTHSKEEEKLRPLWRGRAPPDPSAYMEGENSGPTGHTTSNPPTSFSPCHIPQHLLSSSLPLPQSLSLSLLPEPPQTLFPPLLPFQCISLPKIPSCLAADPNLSSPLDQGGFQNC